jgi:hypothetical protein
MYNDCRRTSKEEKLDLENWTNKRDVIFSR